MRLESNVQVEPGTLEYVASHSGGAQPYFAWRPRGKVPEGRDAWNRIYLREGTVSRIQINSSDGLTLGSVVEMLGAPDGVRATLGATEFWGFTVVLDYPSKGISIRSFTYPVNRDEVVVREGVGLVSEDLAVTRLEYYVPSSLRRALADVFGHPPEKVDAILDEVQLWHGFGTVVLGVQERW